MNNRQFDSMLRRRAREEQWSLNPKIEDALHKTLLNPKPVFNVQRHTKRGFAFALGAAVMICIAALVVSNLKPNADLTAKPLARESTLKATTADAVSPFLSSDNGYGEDHTFRTRMEALYRNHRVQIDYRITNITNQRQAFTVTPLLEDSQGALNESRRCVGSTISKNAALNPQESVSGSFVLYLLDPTQGHQQISAGVSIVQTQNGNGFSSTLDVDNGGQTEAGKECFVLDCSFASLAYQMVGSDFEYLNDRMLYMRVEYRASARQTLEALLAQRPGQTVAFDLQLAGQADRNIIQGEIYQAEDGTWRLPYFCLFDGVKPNVQAELYTTYQNQAETMRVGEESYSFVPSGLMAQKTADNAQSAVDFMLTPTFSGRRMDCQLQVHSRMSADDPLYVHWALQPDNPNLTLAQAPMGELWLPGGTGYDHAVWLGLEDQDQPITGNYAYEVYTLCNKATFYHEDDFVMPVLTEEYKAQQQRFTQAYAQGKVIVAGWNLVLPDTVQPSAALPGAQRQQEAIKVYCDNQRLAQVESYTGSYWLENADVPASAQSCAKPLNTVCGEGYTTRLMQADLLTLRTACQPIQYAAYVVTDILFDSREAMEAFQTTRPGLCFMLCQKQGSAVVSEHRYADTDGFAWQDEAGMWHRTFVNAMENIQQSMLETDAWLVTPAQVPLDGKQADSSAWTLYPEESLTMDLNSPTTLESAAHTSAAHLPNRTD